MASQFDSWESYFYPDTIDPLTGIGTLRNLYDERDVETTTEAVYEHVWRVYPTLPSPVYAH